MHFRNTRPSATMTARPWCHPRRLTLTDAPRACSTSCARATPICPFRLLPDEPCVQFPVAEATFPGSTVNPQPSEAVARSTLGRSVRAATAPPAAAPEAGRPRNLGRVQSIIPTRPRGVPCAGAARFLLGIVERAFSFYESTQAPKPRMRTLDRGICAAPCGRQGYP